MLTYVLCQYIIYVFNDIFMPSDIMHISYSDLLNACNIDICNICYPARLLDSVMVIIIVLTIVSCLCCVFRPMWCRPLSRVYATWPTGYSIWPPQQRPRSVNRIVISTTTTIIIIILNGCLLFFHFLFFILQSILGHIVSILRKCAATHLLNYICRDTCIHVHII